MKKGILLTLLLILGTINGYSQQMERSDWAYEAYPELPFQLEHIALDLTIEPATPLIKGTGIFSVKSRRPELSTVVFQTSDMDIKDVLIKGTTTEFRVSMDSLIIYLPEAIKRGATTDIQIIWESASPYGIHADVYGNLWTSLNPKSRHHWLPIPDHPEVSATLEASINLPAEMDVILNGSAVEDEVVSADEKQVTWKSETAIPVSGLTLAIGKFRNLSARSGIKEVSLYAPEDLLLEEVHSNLLSLGIQILKETENRFSFEFPYESLNIVVLQDNKWEEKQSGAGVIYLYENLGSLTTQLRRGIAEQWFGNYHRYLDVMDHRVEFLKTLVSRTDESMVLMNPNGLRSIDHWNFWVKGGELLEDEFMKEVILESLPDLIKEFDGVVHWDEYASLWYDITGTYWDVLPAPEAKASKELTNYIYDVEYQYDEINAALTLNFVALGEPVATLVGVEVTQFSFMDTSRTEISFTGAEDAIGLNLDSGVDYVTLKVLSDQNVNLEENKPFMFLIRQLRSSEKELQLQAINGLQSYTDNPDLQLALQDVLKGEEDPEVRAELTQVLSQITQGASGTEQTFLENLRSSNQGIRLSGLKALASYTENESVSSAVRNVILRAESDTVFTTAIQTYKQLVPTEELLALAERLQRDEGREHNIIHILSVTAPSDSTKKTLDLLNVYVEGNYPYSVRKSALMLMIESNQDPAYWSDKLGSLLNDRDPRIRYNALDAIQFVSPKRTTELLIERSKEEMDPRILYRLESMMSDTNK